MQFDKVADTAVGIQSGAVNGQYKAAPAAIFQQDYGRRSLVPLEVRLRRTGYIEMALELLTRAATRRTKRMVVAPDYQASRAKLPMSEAERTSKVATWAVELRLDPAHRFQFDQGHRPVRTEDL